MLQTFISDDDLNISIDNIIQELDLLNFDNPGVFKNLHEIFDNNLHIK